MRLVAGIVLVARGFEDLTGDVAIGPSAALIARMVLGLSIIAGLWTPITGVLVTILEIALFALRPGDPWIHVFLATIGFCLSLLGPGAWSVDARLFGFRRINIEFHDRQGQK